jgi:hypothetical protein
LSFQYLHKFILDNTKVIYLYNHLIFLIFLQGIEIKSVLISYWNSTGCSEKKLSKNLTQTFMAYGNGMICQQATLLGEAERPKVADAVIEALSPPLPAPCPPDRLCPPPPLRLSRQPV